MEYSKYCADVSGYDIANITNTCKYCWHNHVVKERCDLDDYKYKCRYCNKYIKSLSHKCEQWLGSYVRPNTGGDCGEPISVIWKTGIYEDSLLNKFLSELLSGKRTTLELRIGFPLTKYLNYLISSNLIDIKFPT